MRRKANARRRFYQPLSLDELARVAGLDPHQKILMRRYLLNKFRIKGVR